MGEVAHGASQDFWRAPAPRAVLETDASHSLVEACDRCEAEFIVGSRFCHNCGASRSQSTRAVQAGVFQLSRLGERLGLSTAALLASSVGVFCVVAAVSVGFVFSVKTVLDWQAVQLWRIEWLLGAAVALLAGCLLQKTR